MSSQDDNSRSSEQGTGCWEAIKVLLMVCGALFIALVVLVIGICGH